MNESLKVTSPSLFKNIHTVAVSSGDQLYLRIMADSDHQSFIVHLFCLCSH